MRGRLVAALLLTALAAGPVLAQPASKPLTESVTVTGTKDRQAIEGFVQSLATPTRAAEKLARWQNNICPVVMGLKLDFTKFIGRRIREVASLVGAPVNTSATCENNIAIVFTATPQALVDNIRAKHPALLGYYDSKEQLDRLAAVVHPIQAWYRTATQDAHGQLTLDTGKTEGQGLMLTFPCSDEFPGMGMGGLCSLQLSEAHGAAVTGSRLGDGLRSGLYNVIIVADPARLAEYEIGALADYIAMRALAQITLPDGCQLLPSVLNMLAENCGQKTNALTANDIAFLQGLYKMGPDRTARIQKGEIAYQMQQSLEGK